MSLIRDPVIITAVGHQMMTAGGDITYTKATLYGQDISHLTKDQLESLTSIGNPLLTVPVGISDKSVDGEQTTIALEATFTNANLKADLPYKAVGFFAKKDNGEEKLVILGVANSGAYLAAASPDGVASDALDVKVAIAIGDATSVTAVVDPAGSVTPATLNGAINKATHDLTAKIDTKADKTDVTAQFATKADKTTVEQEFAVKANSADVDKELTTKANASDVYTKKQVDDALSKKDDTADVDQKIATVNKSVSDLSDTVSANKTATDASLATKANASDVADNVKTLQANINTKANKATVDAEIAKIDFTPYAKSADVAKDLQGYTTTADLTKLLAGKRDIADSYSRDELDKKFLQLSTDTSGKVGADQVAQLIAGKADKDAVDKQIKAVTDSVATKANSDDVYSKTEANNLITDAKNTGKQAQATADSALAGYNKRPVISGGASDDLLSFKTTQLRYYPGNGNTCKNLPPATNQQWFTVEYIFENPNGDGIAIYRSPANEIWTIGNNGGHYEQAWVKVANANDIQGLQNQVNTKLASGDLPTELQKITFRKQYVDGSNKLQDGRWKLVKQADGSYLVDLYHDDWTAQRVADLLNQIGSKADTATVNSQVADAKNAATKAQTTADNANNNANGRLSLNGGTMGSTAQISFADSGTWGTSNKPAGKRGGLRWDGQSDSAEIYADEDGSDNLDLVFQIGDDGSNHFSFRNQVGAEVAAIQSNGHYTGTIDWASVNGRPDVATHADVNNKVNVQGDLFRLATAGNTWVDILGVANSDTPVLVSIRDQGSGNLLGNYAAAIAFGGGDTKGVLNVAYSDHTARIIGGNGNAPVWHEDIAWKSDIDRLQSIINQQNQTIQSLTSRLNNAENEINYIKANYVEGRTFPASQEAQANSWENENPQRIAFITK